MMRTTGSCRRGALIGACALLAVLAAGEAAAQILPGLGECSNYVLSSPSESFDAAGGSGSFTVSWTWTPPESGTECIALCSPQACQLISTPRTTASWITVASAAPNLSSHTVSYTVAANNNSLLSRNGTITAGLASFTVTQAGYQCPTLPGSVAPSSNNFSRTGGSFDVAVGGNALCAWNVHL